MAPRLVTIAAVLAVAGLILVPVAAVLWRGGGPSGLAPGDAGAFSFTIWQAALSAALSVGLAIPVARALARLRFPGRAALITIMGAPFILPVIVAILGLLAVFGGNGWVNSLLEVAGFARLDIYGVQGILLAHVFFNLPLAVRMILQGWLAIPSERFRVAATLGVPVSTFIERPMLRRICPGAFAVIFAICTGSFAVALTLGGGPAATTVELAIYQAFRFDFDLARAATLAILQLGIGLAAGIAALHFSRADGLGSGLDRVVQRWDGSAFVDAFWIAASALFLLAPIAAVVLAGLPHVLSLPAEVWSAAGRSVVLALGSTVLTLLLAVPLAGQLGQSVSILGISVSGLVLGTGLFILLQPFVRPNELALPVTMIVNAVMALPFATRILGPAIAETRTAYGRMAASLAMDFQSQLRLVYLPRMLRPLGFAAGLSAALAMGDLGVIALFGGADTATLPLQIYRLMGSYQMEAASGAALLLLAISLCFFIAFDALGRSHASV